IATFIVLFSPYAHHPDLHSFPTRRSSDLTNGRVRVQVYPNSELYRDREELEALQLGAVEMIAPSLSKFGPLGVREFEVFDLPFLFPDEAALHRITNGPIGAGMLQRLRLKGVIGLAFWD